MKKQFFHSKPLNDQMADVFSFFPDQNTAGAADTHCESSSCGTKHICSREQVTSPGLQEIWGSNRKHFQFVVRNFGRAKNHRFNH
jgi:hypothetical protein